MPDTRFEQANDTARCDSDDRLMAGIPNSNCSTHRITMTNLAAYPDDLDECHRLLARFQAQFAVLEQKQQAWCEQEQLYADLQKAHQQTTTDLLKLREDYGEVLHQLELLRRWAFGARRERVVDDPRQKHLFALFRR